MKTTYEETWQAWCDTCECEVGVGFVVAYATAVKHAKDNHNHVVIVQAVQKWTLSENGQDDDTIETEAAP